MKITKISVEGLFGIFNHEIPLNIKERITIIHGLNGFGKSNILRILNGIFNSDYNYLEYIPFHYFSIDFKDKSSFSIEKTIHNLEDNYKKNTILFSLNKPELETSSFTIEYIITSFNKNYQRDKKNGFRKKRFRRSSEKDNSSIVKVTNELKNALENKPEADWLKDIKIHNSIHLIESQRLLDSGLMSPTVSTYSKEIAKLMQDKFAEYGKESQSLDRTFPIRAVQQQHSSDLTDEQLKEQLNELEDTRNRLTELGLLDKEENSEFSNQLQDQDIDDSTRSILSVYVEDTKKKLNIFNNIASKIELLKTIINRKFAYSYKEMNFSKEQGFVFTTCYPNSSESDLKTIAPTDLSSGEQHELVLLYELLFKVEPNSLVLIDEPELSLHVGWQSQFLKDLQEITELADLDILMATHSPDIIQDRWDDLTVELKAPGK